MFRRSSQLFHSAKLLSCCFHIYQSRPQGVFPYVPLVLWTFAFLALHPPVESLGTYLITKGQIRKQAPTALCRSYNRKQLQTQFCHLVWGSVGLPCLLGRTVQGTRQIHSRNPLPGGCYSSGECHLPLLQPRFFPCGRGGRTSFGAYHWHFCFCCSESVAGLTALRVQTSLRNISLTRVQTPQSKHISIFWRYLWCQFFRCGQLSIRKGNHLTETDYIWAGMASEQQNESTKNAKFKAKNWELKTTGVNCLASCDTGSLSCSRSPDPMCKIDIVVLSIFLFRFVLPRAVKPFFFLFFFPPGN